MIRRQQNCNFMPPPMHKRVRYLQLRYDRIRPKFGKQSARRCGVTKCGRTTGYSLRLYFSPVNKIFFCSINFIFNAKRFEVVNKINILLYFNGNSLVLQQIHRQYKNINCLKIRLGSFKNLDQHNISLFLVVLQFAFM